MKKFWQLLPIVFCLAGCASVPSPSTTKESKLHITTTSLASTRVGAIYSQQFTASGGFPPYTWSLASGELPKGVSLSKIGVLSGIPQAEGDYNFIIQVTDSKQMVSLIQINWREL